jgi:hypothetical protein
VNEFRDKTSMVRFSLSMLAVLLHPASEDEPKEVKTELTRERSLVHFVSLRSLFHYVGRGGLSRVKMNALRARLTALPVLRERCRYFLLDSADAFIDGLLSLAIAISPECPGGYRREVECSPLWEAQGSGGQFTTL